MRIFGPARSSSTPTQRSARSAASRTCASRRLRSATVPCEALRRTTSSPARIICVSTSRSSVAGPSVATILARLSSVPLVPSFGLSLTGALLEHRHCRQRLALDELEERATARGDIGDAVLDAVFLDRRKRVAAAGERECLAARDCLSDGAGALTELLELEHTHRAVPDDGAGSLQQRAAAVGAVGPDVEDHLVAAHLGDRTYVR